MNHIFPPIFFLSIGYVRFISNNEMKLRLNEKRDANQTMRAHECTCSEYPLVCLGLTRQIQEIIFSFT